MGTNKINLSSTLVIDKSINIVGEDNDIILDGTNSCRVMNINTDETDVRLEKLRIQNGMDPENIVGGIYNSADATLTLINCIISDNKATGVVDGYGGIGGIYQQNVPAYLNIVNSTISNNEGAASDEGAGGIYAYGTVKIYNTIIYGNVGQYPNAYFDWQNAEITSDNSLYGDAQNDVNISHDGGGNLFATDPKFVGKEINPDNPYLIYGISPCEDLGNNSNIETSSDIRGTGFGRKLNKTDAASAGNVDMGAYEYKHLTDPYAPITFDSQGGSSVATQGVIYNGKLSEPAVPTKENYDFVAWYKDVACTNLWDFDNDPVIGEATVYAKWKPHLADQAAPTGLAGVAVTTAADKDGKITGTTTAMEYKLSTEPTTWTPATETEITGLAAGTYNVRYAAKAGCNAGTAAEIIVPAYAATNYTLNIGEEQNGGAGKIRTITIGGTGANNLIDKYLAVQFTQGSGVDAKVSVVTIQASSSVTVSYQIAGTYRSCVARKWDAQS